MLLEGADFPSLCGRKVAGPEAESRLFGAGWSCGLLPEPGRALQGLECCVTVTAGLSGTWVCSSGKTFIPSARNAREVRQCPTLGVIVFGHFTGFQVLGFLGIIFWAF